MNIVKLQITALLALALVFPYACPTSPLPSFAIAPYHQFSQIVPKISPRVVTSSSKIPNIVIIMIFLVPFICALGFLGGRFYIRRKHRDESEETDEELNNLLCQAAQSVRSFAYADLSVATNNFSDDYKIGSGGFGCVYRGALPGTNEAVAVKRISATASQGKKEYVSEVIINSKLTHHNLVRFLGWCHRNDDLLLVHELLSNGSLDKYLFGETEGALNWDRRYGIACDVASALVYLHEDRHESVVHRDIKASNVMLDSNFKAKLGDFGLARVMEREKGGLVQEHISRQ